MDLAQELDLLAHGSIHVRGLFEYGSNYTFLCDVGARAGERSLRAVYKPAQGTQPLWDFDAGSLAKREVAAYLVSQALNWNLVPPTVLRANGPYGEGSLQAYRELDLTRNYFVLRESAPDRLRTVAVFDLLANNADRKAGHVALDRANQLWLIDHGLCFHAEPKMRTVIWDYAGEQIPAPLVEAAGWLAGQLQGKTDLRRALGRLLSPEEIAALKRRAQAIVAEPVFPLPGPGRNIPWPVMV
jgi:hypothetical protein